jgi:hypothetical protein
MASGAIQVVTWVVRRVGVRGADGLAGGVPAGSGAAGAKVKDTGIAGADGQGTEKG